jgi:hypothetical protein
LIRGSGRRVSIQQLRPIKHQRNNNWLMRTRNRNLSDINWQGRITPVTTRAPPLTTVQRVGVKVLDEPSMVGLMVWVELWYRHGGHGSAGRL